MYSLRLPQASGTLVFSFIGSISRDIPLTGQTTINVVLEEDTKVLEEVGVVEYDTQRRRKVTGAVSSMKADELQKVATNSFASAIQGKIPGVYISQTSGAPGELPR